MDIIFVWLSAAAILVAAELGHPGLFFFLSCAVGCLCAAGTIYFTESFVAQASVFLGSTLIAFFPLQWWARRKQLHSKAHLLTNVYANIGKKGVVVIELVPGKTGAVRVLGQLWSAKSSTEIAQNSVVEVVDIVGVHLIVKPLGGHHGII
jgi:membrane protein implicated in regulation of membrane protease activity